MRRLLGASALLVWAATAIRVDQAARLRSTAVARLEMWPANGTLGSLDAKQTKETEKVVVRSLPIPDPDAKTNDDKMKAIKGLNCDSLDDKRIDLEKEYELLREKVEKDAFEVKRLRSTAVRLAKENPGKASILEKDLAEKNADALELVNKREMERYPEVEMEVLYTIEQYSLKCGVKDKYCRRAGEDVNKLYKELQDRKQNLQSKMMEAGWLKAESEAFLASPRSIDQAKAKFDAAWGEAQRLYKDEQRLSYMVNLKAAACGLRPPLSPWSTPASGCDMKPEDKEMRRLLKEDPRTFVRVWKEEIGRKAGIKPEYIRVDSECLGVPDKKKKKES